MSRLFLFMTLFSFVATSAVAAITPEELARLSDKGAADKRKVEQQLNLDDLRYQIQLKAAEQLKVKNASRKYPAPAVAGDDALMLPIKESKNNVVVKQAETASYKKSPSSKYSRSSEQDGTVNPQRQRREHPQNLRNNQRQVSQKYTRSAPAQQQTSTSGEQTTSNAHTATKKTVAYSDAVLPDNKRYFGIRRGTWIKAELRRDVNNAEPGDVELYLIQEVHGKRRTLPVDTQLFADKGFNSATQRLDLITTYAITPSGREFVLKARIYDTFKVSGLNGIIDADDSKIATRGASTSLAALGSGILGEVGGSNLIGQSLSKGGQSMINDQQRASDIETQRQITIFVAPQPLLLRVEETF